MLFIQRNGLPDPRITATLRVLAFCVVCLLFGALVAAVQDRLIQPAHSAAGSAGMLSSGGATTAIGTTAVAALPAGAALRYLLLENVSASGTIWCSPIGTAVVNGAGSIALAAGGPPLVFDNTQGIPTNAWSCIGTAAGLTLTVLAQ